MQEYLPLLFILLWVLLAILWIVTLIKQAKENDWVWFVITLVFSPAMFVYWLMKIISK